MTYYLQFFLAIMFMMLGYRMFKYDWCIFLCQTKPLDVARTITFIVIDAIGTVSCAVWLAMLCGLL